MDRPTNWTVDRTIDRRAFSAAALAFLVHPKLYALQAGTSTPAASAHDASAVYSLILSARCTCCQDAKGKWLIDDHTYAPALPIIGAKTESPIEAARLGATNAYHPSINPPAESKDVAAAMLADLQQKLAPPVAIDANLDLPSPYRLISAEENRQYFLMHSQGNVYSPESAARAASVPDRYRREFEGAYGVISLSPIGFNSELTMALFSYKQIGGGCSDESWHVLERSAGSSANAWRELKWPTTGVGMCT